MTEAQTTTVSDEAVQAAVEGIQEVSLTGELISDEELAIAALTAALPYLALSSAPCSVEVKDIAILQRIAKYADQFDEPDENGAFPDIQDAMVTVGDLRSLRRILSQIVTKPVDVATVREQPWYIIMPERDPFAAGFEARQAGIDDDGNPFDEGTSKTQDWSEGWDSADDEAAAIRALSPAKPAQGEQWHEITTAEKRAIDVILRVPSRDGRSFREVIGHWGEDLSGEEQPPFRGWFYDNGHSFTQITPDPTHWRALTPARRTTEGGE